MREQSRSMIDEQSQIRIENFSFAETFSCNFSSRIKKIKNRKKVSKRCDEVF